MVCIKALLSFVAVSAVAVSAAPLEKRGAGQGTYYYQNGNPGACGHYSSDSDYVVALNTNEYAGGAHCGQTLTIKNKQNGKTIQAKAMDLCPSCVSGGIDLSEGAFSALGNKDQGVLPLEWYFD